MGIRPPCVLKCDGEASVEALREAVMVRMGEGAVPQGPPAGESQSNGVVENGVQMLKGLIRVHVLALERKLGVRFPADHPILAWIVEAVADMATKHLRGHDGRTGYERLFGKAPPRGGPRARRVGALEAAQAGRDERPPGGAMGGRDLAWEELGRHHAPGRGGA